MPLGNRELDLALGYTALGDERRARPHLESVAAELARQPEDPQALTHGAVALELLGRRAEALRAADHAVHSTRNVRDAVNNPGIALMRSWVLIRSGTRSEEGYVELERWLGAFGQQPRWVAAQPLWQILRDDARAQKIIRDRFPTPG